MRQSYTVTVPEEPPAAAFPFLNPEVRRKGSVSGSVLVSTFFGLLINQAKVRDHAHVFQTSHRWWCLLFLDVKQQICSLSNRLILMKQYSISEPNTQIVFFFFHFLWVYEKEMKVYVIYKSSSSKLVILLLRCHDDDNFMSGWVIYTKLLSSIGIWRPAGHRLHNRLIAALTDCPTVELQPNGHKKWPILIGPSHPGCYCHLWLYSIDLT